MSAVESLTLDGRRKLVPTVRTPASLRKARAKRSIAAAPWRGIAFPFPSPIILGAADSRADDAPQEVK